MPMTPDQARQFADTLKVADPDELEYQQWLKGQGFNSDYTLNTQGQNAMTQGPEQPLVAPPSPASQTELLPLPELAPTTDDSTTAPPAPTDVPQDEPTLASDLFDTARFLSRVPSLINNGVVKQVPRAVEFIADLHTFWSDTVVKDNPELASAVDQQQAFLFKSAGKLDEFMDSITGIKPSTPAEHMVSDIAGLVVGTTKAVKAAKALGLGRFSSGLAGGVATDLILTDPDDGTLLQQLGALPAEIKTDALAAINSEADPQEVEETLYNRWKQRAWATAEGAAIGSILEFGVDGVRLMAKHFAGINASRKITQAADPKLLQAPIDPVPPASPVRDDVIELPPSQVREVTEEARTPQLQKDIDGAIDEALRDGDVPDIPGFVAQNLEIEIPKDIGTLIAERRLLRLVDEDMANELFTSIRQGDETLDEFIIRQDIEFEDAKDLAEFREQAEILASEARRVEPEPVATPTSEPTPDTAPEAQAPTTPPEAEAIPVINKRDPASTVRTGEGDTLEPNPVNINTAEDIVNYVRKFDPRGGQEPIDIEAILRGEQPLTDSITALRAASTAADKALDEALTDAVRLGTPEAENAYLKLFEITSTLVRAESGVRSELGRGLNSLQREVDGDISVMKSIQRKMRANGQGTSVSAQDMAKRLLNMTPAERLEFMNQATPSTVGDLLGNLMFNSLLSNPATQVRNIVGNAFSMGLQIPEKMLADAFRTGDIRPAMRQFQALGSGWVDTLAAMGNTRRTGQELFGSAKLHSRNLDLTDALGIRTDTSFGKAAAQVGTFLERNSPTRMLSTADTFFKMTSYRMELYRLAAEEASNQGLKGQEFSDTFNDIVANPKDFNAIHQAAASESRMRTFTNDLLDPMGTGVSARGATELDTVGQVRRSSAALQDSPLLRHVLPFMRIGVNTVEFAVERTPVLGLLSKKTRDNITGVNGPRARSEAAAKWAIGGSTMMAGLWLAENGFITGRGPKDRNEAKRWREAGHKEYMFRVPGTDIGMGFGNDATLKMLFGMPADIRTMANANPEDIGTLVQGTALGISEVLTDNQWFDNVSRIMEIVGRAQDAKDSDKAIKELGKLLTTLAPVAAVTRPGIVTAMRKLSDPIAREVNGISDRVANNFPGFSETLPPKLNRFGEPITWHGSAAEDTAINVISAISPFGKFTVDEKSPGVAMAMEVNAGMSVPPKRIQGVELNDEMHRRYIELASNPRGAVPYKQALDAVAKQVERLGYGEERQKTLIRNLDRKYKNRARAQLKREFPEIDEQIQEAKNQ